MLAGGAGNRLRAIVVLAQSQDVVLPLPGVAGAGGQEMDVRLSELADDGQVRGNYGTTSSHRFQELQRAAALTRVAIDGKQWHRGQVTAMK